MEGVEEYCHGRRPVRDLVTLVEYPQGPEEHVDHSVVCGLLLGVEGESSVVEDTEATPMSALPIVPFRVPVDESLLVPSEGLQVFCVVLRRGSGDVAGPLPLGGGGLAFAVDAG